MVDIININIYKKNCIPNDIKQYEYVYKCSVIIMLNVWFMPY